MRWIATCMDIFSLPQRPTEEELQTIDSFMKKNPEAILDRPEQFLLNLSGISCYEERLYCMMLRTAVSDSLADIGQKLTNFRLVCEVCCLCAMIAITLLFVVNMDFLYSLIYLACVGDHHLVKNKIKHGMFKTVLNC